MNRTDYENKSFDELIDQLCDEGPYCLHSYNSLKDYASYLIDEDDLLTALHILNALFNDDANWYNYDTDMGTLETPTPLTCKEDLSDYIED